VVKSVLLTHITWYMYYVLSLYFAFSLPEYIYHRTSPMLPRLAVLFLRRLAVVLPMSIRACLGGQAEAIRDACLMRLELRTEVRYCLIF